MAKREFLLLAHNLDLSKTGIGGWLMSEKLDGMRAFWDAGITRGMYASEVPFANIEKDGRYREKPRATGLWSRYGKTIQAPGWWLDCLPPFPLDGELYIERGRFQTLTSIVKDLHGNEEWNLVKFKVFDSPSLSQVFPDGNINNTNFKKVFNGVESWCNKRLNILGLDLGRMKSFEGTYNLLKRILVENKVVQLHEQEMLPWQTSTAMERVNEQLDIVTTLGGEGLMLRHPSSIWIPERSHKLLKVKKWLDAEGQVIGYTWGRRTDLGSKLLGLMGAMLVSYNSKLFELSGFTDAERQLAYQNPDGTWDYERAHQAGVDYPGEPVRNPMIMNPSFMPGSKITFRYRELTDAGIPKEARYWRKI